MCEAVKLILSDETLADEIAQNGRKTLDTMAALKELQRLRAAFAWFQRQDVLALAFWNGLWCVERGEETLSIGATALEAIEALSAEVKP